MSEIYNLIQAAIQHDKIKLNESMKGHTTFKAGGKADFFIAPDTAGEFKGVIAVCRNSGIPFFVLGNGSNVLVKDEGFRGVIISTKNLNSIKLLDEDRIFAGSGAVLSKIANFALDNDLAGFEFASGIPGTVGGAIFMNAGAYGSEMTDVFESAEALLEDNTTAEMVHKDMSFSYRGSIIQKKEIFILSTVIRLRKGNYMSIKDKMLDLNKRRADKQPLDMPSAGSAFKRPADSFAGKLIMEAGLKGYSIGGAQISEKHCGFIVNTGGATANDIISLMEYVQGVVFEKFAVMLEPEFLIIG